MGMTIENALERAKSWEQNHGSRPSPSIAREVAKVLADHCNNADYIIQNLLVGRKVLVERGNTDRGPETGPGFGRRVSATIIEAPVGYGQIACRLLDDDEDAVGPPNKAGDVGLWSVSQIIFP